MEQASAGLYQGVGAEFLTDERCHISEIMNTDRSEDVSVARARVEPGVTTQLHSLTVAERYIVESGQGVMELHGNQRFVIGPGDCVLIPEGVAQRVRNPGQVDLVFLCICTPRFEPDQYVNLETDDTPELLPA